MNVLILFLLGLRPVPTPVPVPVPRSCEEIVCSHVPDCAPMIIGGRNFTSYTACMAEYHCPKYELGCLNLLEHMPCLPENPTWEDIEAFLPHATAFRDLCVLGW